MSFDSLYPPGHQIACSRWFEAAHAGTAMAITRPDSPDEPAGVHVANHERRLVTVRRLGNVIHLGPGRIGSRSGRIDPETNYARVTIGGWDVAVKQDGKVQQGKYVLFFEPDSFLPAGSPFEDLFAEVGPLITFNDKPGYRVGTSVWTGADGRRLFTHGLVVPLSSFRDIDAKVRDLHFARVQLTEEEFANFVRKIDFSSDLGVTKWENPLEPGFLDMLEKRHGSARKATRAADKGAIDMASSQAEPSPSVTDTQPAPCTYNPKPPSCIIKTSMERVQNCPNLFVKAKYKRYIFQETTKLDGTSVTVYFIPNTSALFATLPTLPPLDDTNKYTYLAYAAHPNGRMGVCTRTQDLLPHLLPNANAPMHDTIWRAVIAARLHKILPAANECIAVQGELVGATIQGNPYNMPARGEGGGGGGGGKGTGSDVPASPASPAHRLFVFSITDLGRASKRRHPRRVEAFAARHALPHVPVRGYSTVTALARCHADLIERAERTGGEGLVFKCCNDGRWFKVLSSKWIMEKGDERHARAGPKGKGREPVVEEAVVMEGEEEVEEGAVGPEDAWPAEEELVVEPQPEPQLEVRPEVQPEKQEAVQEEEQDDRRFRGWEMSQEEKEQLYYDIEHLDEWMEREPDLREWLDTNQPGWQKGHAEFVQGRRALRARDEALAAARNGGRVAGVMDVPGVDHGAGQAASGWGTESILDAPIGDVAGLPEALSPSKLSAEGNGANQGNEGWDAEPILDAPAQGVGGTAGESVSGWASEAQSSPVNFDNGASDATQGTADTQGAAEQTPQYKPRNRYTPGFFACEARRRAMNAWLRY